MAYISKCVLLNLISPDAMALPRSLLSEWLISAKIAPSCDGKILGCHRNEIFSTETHKSTCAAWLGASASTTPSPRDHNINFCRVSGGKASTS